MCSSSHWQTLWEEEGSGPGDWEDGEGLCERGEHASDQEVVEGVGKRVCHQSEPPHEEGRTYWTCCYGHWIRLVFKVLKWF